MVAIGILWLTVAGGGLLLVADYANSPGIAANPSLEFPADSQIRRFPDRPTLIMLVHPHCPCSRASIGELAVLMAESEKPVMTYVLFLKPSGFTDDWEQTDLWRSASEIPRVNVMQDEDGREARFFDAITSGQTFLYDADGQLLFKGGITSARGHSGDNTGRSVILSFLNKGKAGQTETDVYGCPLFNANSECRKPDSKYAANNR